MADVVGTWSILYSREGSSPALEQPRTKGAIMDNEILRLDETDYLAFKAYWIDLGTLREVADSALLARLNAARAEQIAACYGNSLRVARAVKGANPGLAAACCDLHLKTCENGVEGAYVLAMGAAAKRKLVKGSPVRAQAVVDEVERMLSEDPGYGDGGAVHLSLAGLCLDVAARFLKDGKADSSLIDPRLIREQLDLAASYLQSARELGARGFTANSVADRYEKLSIGFEHFQA